MSEASISTILKASGLAKAKHGRACHLAKIVLEVIFLTSFCKTDFVDLQSTLNKNSWFKRSS